MFHNQNEFRIFAWFARHPFTRVGVRELAGILDMNPATMSRALSRLLKRHIVTKRDGGHVADTGSKEYIYLKESYNLYTLRKHGIIEHLSTSLKPEAIIAFGSYIRGEDHEDSDIDLAIINPAKSHSLSPKEKIAGRTISLHLLKKPKIPSDLRISIINGVTLYGVLDI